MRIKKRGFTKKEEKAFDKMELEDAYAKNLYDLDKDYDRKYGDRWTNPRSTDILEGRITAGSLLNDYAVRGDTGKMAYQAIARDIQKRKERHMKKLMDSGREHQVDSYLSRVKKNAEEKRRK